MADKALVHAARGVSLLCTPFLIPTFAFLFFFSGTFLRMVPQVYKLVVLGIVLNFTFVVPVVVILLHFRMIHATPQMRNDRSYRFTPYLLTILSYLFGLYMVRQLNVPWYMTGILIAALFTIVVCLLANIRWKLSEHAAGAGVATGCLVAFGALLGFNPVGWLCVAILASGIVGTARLILHRHTLGEVLAGFAVGLICTLLVLHPLSILPFRHLLF